MQITHAKSLTIADGANTDIVRPSDWNSGHALALTLTGNTAGNSTVSGTNILWEGGPGVTLSGTGSTVVISAGGAGGGGGGAAISAGTQSQNTGTVIFSNSNGVTFGLSNGTLTAAHNGLTSQSVQTQNLVSVLGSTGNISFGNANGITFGGNASTITASHNALTSQSNQAFSAAGGSSAFQTLSFANSNGVSFSNSNGSVVASVATNYAASDHSHGNPTLALTNLSGTTASNSAGFTLSLSAAAGGGGADGNNALAVNGGGTQSATTYTLSNGNNVSFGIAAGVITATASYSQSTAPSAIVGSNATYTSGSVTFTGSNAVTVRSTTGQQIVIDAPVQTVQTQSLVSVQGSTGAISFGNANGVTFGFNASTITASHNGLTSQSNQAFSAGGGSSAFQTLSFANGNGVTFTNTNGSVGASVATTYRASNDAVGLNTAATNVTWTVNSAGISLNAGGYAGTGTSATNASVTLNSNGLAISVAAPGGGGAINVSAGTTSGNLQTVVFSNSNGVTFGLDGSTVTASVAAGGGGAATLNYFNPQDGYVQVAGQQGNASLHIQPMQAPNVTLDRIAMPVVVTNATNSTGTVTVSFSIGVYTRADSTFSLLDSTSGSQAITFSGTVNNSTYAGMRLMTIPWATSLSEAQYFLGIWSRTTSGGANATISQFLASQINSVYSGILGQASNTSGQYTRGLGHYSVTFSTAMPSSIAASELRGTASVVLRQPVFYLVNGTL